MSGSISQLFDNFPDDEVQRTRALGRVVDIARNLWKGETGSPNLDFLAQKAGDAARVEANRVPLGESGLLEFFCSVVSTQGVRSSLIIQCLRIIGNSSADTDENRAKVVASGCLPSIVSLLNNDSVLAYVIPVLFNISVDYEPAQKAIYQAGINPELVSLISGPRLENAAPLMSYICKLLSFVATKEPEANLVHPATPFILLSLANNQPSPIDAEDFLGQVSVALTYLSQEQFQQTFLETEGSIDLVLRTFSVACQDIDTSQDPDNETQLQQVQTAFTATLADLSAQPLFTSSCPLDGPEVQILQGWISRPHIPLRSAACLTLGNIARSDEKCIYLVQQRAVHKPLIENIADPGNTDAGLLHSILSFLKNLAIPAENKPILGGAGLLEADVLPRIWGLETQTQVQFDAVSLTRLLLVGCPENVHRICAPLSEDAASSSHNRSKLHLLMNLNARSDQEPTQMETARAITAVCRVLHSRDSPPASEREIATDSPPATTAGSLSAFYKIHSTITDAMQRLIQQTKFPALRSEQVFVFALMARTTEGAVTVARAMHQGELVSAIVEIVTGSPAPTPSTSAPNGESEQTASSSLSDLQQLANLEAQTPTNTTTGARKSMRDIDRENALVLIAELLQRSPNDLPDDSKVTFETLLREGGQRLLLERGESKGEGEKA
ncbi:armadillo-type protein [Xylaria digitata]|nr:armadillo-type protein [Xylaria digitata]